MERKTLQQLRKRVLILYVIGALLGSSFLLSSTNAQGTSTNFQGPKAKFYGIEYQPDGIIVDRREIIPEVKFLAEFKDKGGLDSERKTNTFIEKVVDELLTSYNLDTPVAVVQKASWPEQKIVVGFGRNAVLGVADKVIGAVRSGAIRHFFLVGGCDGAKSGRNYYTELVEKIPKDCVVLTLACGKFRFFDKNLGDIGGIPRLLDIGQCNDAHSAIQIALALSKAFDCGVNDLPLSLILSWYEQKAVAILLTLLHLGIKDIRLGPSLPAFISPNVLDVLVKNFNIKPITTPDEDLKAILG